MTEGSEDTRRVAVDGVTVEKTFLPGEFSHPAFRLELVSDRDDPVTVRVTDALPAAFDAVDLGFHLDDEDDPGTAYTDEGLAVELTLAPEDHRSVVYGVRTDDPEAARRWLAPPEVEVEPD